MVAARKMAQTMRIVRTASVIQRKESVAKSIQRRIRWRNLGNEKDPLYLRGVGLF